MDAATMQLIGTGVSTLLPVIPALAQAIEGLFGGGTGAQKLPALVNTLSSVSGDMVTAGKLTSVPDAATLTTLAETVVQQMIAKGQLPSTANPPATPPQPKVSVIASTPAGPLTGKYSLVGTISPL